MLNPGIFKEGNLATSGHMQIMKVHNKGSIVSWVQRLVNFMLSFCSLIKGKDEYKLEIFLPTLWLLVYVSLETTPNFRVLLCFSWKTPCFIE
jgi:hypothetical protein